MIGLAEAMEYGFGGITVARGLEALHLALRFRHGERSLPEFGGFGLAVGVGYRESPESVYLLLPSEYSPLGLNFPTPTTGAVPPTPEVRLAIRSVTIRAPRRSRPPPPGSTRLPPEFPRAPPRLRPRSTPRFTSPRRAPTRFCECLVDRPQRVARTWSSVRLRKVAAHPA